MGLFSLFTLAVGLSMDAFAVAVCKGLAMKKLSLKNMIIIGLWFGIFQAGMPLLGYLLGTNFNSFVDKFADWIAFILLAVIGINMIKEAITAKEEETDASIGFKTMFVLAIATSIDAFAVGVSFAFLNVNIAAAVSFIGIITFMLSAAGVKVGNIFGTKYKAKAEIAGGLILIILGIKILLEHFKIL